RVPLRQGGHKKIQLISQDFPWAFDIGLESSTTERSVMCLDVLTMLHTALQCPLSDTEWGAATEDKHASLIRVRDCWLKMNPASRRKPLILHVDWLGSCVAFGGLVKDEMFARRRLLLGVREPLEMWVVRFQS
ncbi:hypothetical protein BDR07DRAFT_1195765, partial [Suillus spraguei]